MAVLDLGSYSTEEGYYSVGDFGVVPQSQADCPAGTVS